MTTLPFQGSHTPSRLGRYLLVGGVAALAIAGITAGAIAMTSGDSTGERPADSGSLFPGRGPDATITQLQERLAQRPDDVATMVALAERYLQRVRETGDPALYGNAEAVLTKAAALEPENPDVLAARATLALGRHDFRGALALASEAVAIDPERARYYGLRADAEIELGLYDEAVASLQEMVDRRPDFASYSRIAYARELYGDPEGAIEAMEQSLEAGTTIPENRAWALAEIGRLLFVFARFDDADRAYAASLAAFPDYHVALAGQAQIRAAKGDLSGAAATYSRAFDLVPLPGYAIALGDLATRQGDSAAASRHYALVDSIDRLFVANGANTDLEIALFHADRGQDLEATVARARAVYAARPSIHAADVLAWALFRSGAIDEASGFAGQALRLGTLDPIKLYHAGVIAKAAGQDEEAKALLEEALRRNPEFSVLLAAEAKAALAVLQ